MSEKRGLLKLIQRLATDEEFRRRFMVTPREVLMAELGISREVYDALVGLAPVLLAGGLFALGDFSSSGQDGVIQPDWGQWGQYQ